MGADPAQQLFDFARERRALAFVHYAVSGSDNIERRANEISLLIEVARTKLAELREKAKTAPDIKALIPDAKLFHYHFLDVVERLMVLTETLLASVGIVKRDYRRLPFDLLRGGPGGHRQPIRPEVKWAKKTPLRELRRLFLFPAPGKIFGNDDRRLTLARTCNAALHRVSQSLRDLALFYEMFIQIYNKYKHTVAENTGTIEIAEWGGVKRVSTSLFFEDYPPPRRKKARVRPSTWCVIADDEELSYLESTLREVVNLHKLVLVSRLDYLYNQGRPFIPAIGHFLGDAELQDLSAAVDQERTFRTIAQISMATNIEWSPSARARIEKSIARRK